MTQLRWSPAMPHKKRLGDHITEKSTRPVRQFLGIATILATLGNLAGCTPSSSPTLEGGTGLGGKTATANSQQQERGCQVQGSDNTVNCTVVTPGHAPPWESRLLRSGGVTWGGFEGVPSELPPRPPTTTPVNFASHCHEWSEWFSTQPPHVLQLPSRFTCDSGRHLRANCCATH